jgi:hypothetical protein
MVLASGSSDQRNQICARDPSELMSLARVRRSLPGLEYGLAAIYWSAGIRMVRWAANPISLHTVHYFRTRTNLSITS